MLKYGEARIRELDALPSLVEDYLADLPYLVRGSGIPVRDHEVVGPERTPENHLGVYVLTPDNVRKRTPEEMEELRLDLGEHSCGEGPELQLVSRTPASKEAPRER
jgi:hypothetical protein